MSKMKMSEGKGISGETSIREPLVNLTSKGNVHFAQSGSVQCSLIYEGVTLFFVHSILYFLNTILLHRLYRFQSVVAICQVLLDRYYNYVYSACEWKIDPDLGVSKQFQLV